MELGEMIRQKRKDKRWSQLELAKRAGTDEAQISKYERGIVKPTLETLRKIADAFGCEISELLDDVPRKRKMPPEVREKCNQLHALFHELMCMTYEDD